LRILIVEDEKDLAFGIKKGLESQYYTTDVVTDGESALEIIELNSYDLIILDLNLPKLDGISILERIRKYDNYIKILILSARGDVDDKVEGLEKGANDYLVKPFYFQELLARIRSLLRRDFIQKDSLMTCGNITIDTNNKSLYIKEERVGLSKIQYQIIEYLLCNKNTYVTTEELFEHVYNNEKDLFSNSIKVHINNIRKKIRNVSEEDFIKSVRGLGYIIEDI